VGHLEMALWAVSREGQGKQKQEGEKGTSKAKEGQGKQKREGEKGKSSAKRRKA